MAGIGKGYTKGKKFQLRSGNTPSGFKMMGSTTSALKQAEERETSWWRGEEGWIPDELQKNVNRPKVKTKHGQEVEDAKNKEKKENKENKEVKAETDASNIQDNIVDPPKVNKTKTIANKVGNTLVGAFTSGLDAVYGSGKVMPGNKVKFHDPKKKKEEKKFGTTALDNDEE